MPSEGKSNSRFERLRQEAIDLLEHNPDFATPAGSNVKELILELQVHQAELILQNEELKSSQERLAKVSSEYQALYDNAPCGYITLNPKGIITKINITALKLLEEHKIKIGISSLGGFIEPGWDDLYYASLKNAGMSGEKQSLNLKLKSDQNNPIWIQTEIEADRDAQNQVRQWKLIFIDISIKVAAEDALQESQERFKTLFHKTPIAYQSLDEQGRFIEVNDSWLETLGYHRDEVIGKSFADFLHPSMQNHFRDNFPRFKAVGEILGVEFDMLKKDGSNILVSFHGKIGKTNKGNFKQTHCVLSDITKQKEIEKTAKQLEIRLQNNRKLEAIGVLAGGIAHDFNNILHPIIGFSELTLKDLPEDSPLRENLEEILKGSERAAGLVRQILNFSSEKQKLPEPVFVQSIFKEAIKFLRSTIPSHIEFHQEISPEPLYILSDPIQLYEIAMNLCTNAFHAMEDKGGLLSVDIKEVDISSDQDGLFENRSGRYCKISVIDSGVCIPEHNINKIFDPYFTTKDVGKGSGLGLSVVHGIVKEHNGEILVKSRPGKTQFNVYFPIIDAPEQKDQKKTEFSESLGNERVLFVDDEPSIVMLVERSLEKLGYNTKGVTNSLEALQLFESNPDDFDIVISDVAMPKMVGTKFVEKIKNIKPDIPVMLCTGYSNLIEGKKASSLKVDDFLYKPISIKELSSKIRKIIDKSSKS